MRVLLTGSAGRVGRAIHARLTRDGHHAVRLDIAAGPHTDVRADITDHAAVREAMRGAEAIVHCAALHAPHVNLRSDAAFEAINVDATAALLRSAAEEGIRRIVFTSTTALYGTEALAAAAWTDEETVPRPRTIYHRTKVAAERLFEQAVASGGMAVTILRMSRCFPERAPHMAVYRLHRGVDARDVADAHALALAVAQPGLRRYVVSGATPFTRDDVEGLVRDPAAVLARRAPDLVALFAERGWPLPPRIDRVYDPAKAQRELGWRPRHGWRSVVEQLDAGSPEVLPA